MNLTKKAALYGAATLVGLGLAAGSAMAATTTIISDGTINGWTSVADNGSHGANPTIGAVNGPDVANDPNGVGSIQMTTNGTIGGKDYIGSEVLDGTKLSDLSALSYSTYIPSPSANNLVPYINLYVSSGGATPTFTRFTYSPGDYQPSNVTPGTWQTWNTLSTADTYWYAGTAGSKALSLAAYALANPDATIVQHFGGGEGDGVELVAGDSSNTAWTNFSGNVAQFSFTTQAGDTTTYDFQPVPEPASWAAFAFMGLGAAALMFKARKRKALEA